LLRLEKKYAEGESKSDGCFPGMCLMTFSGPLPLEVWPGSMYKRGEMKVEHVGTGQ
jgi:hypothetical protein